MKSMEVKYLGGLRTEGIHLKSGQKVITDAPVDNKGKGEAYSPTDLLCSSLVSCMLTIMGIAADTHGMHIDGATASIEKVMGSDPRRVIEIKINIGIPGGDLSEKHKAVLENAARTCPVAKSLHPDLKQSLTFEYF